MHGLGSIGTDGGVYMNNFAYCQWFALSSLVRIRPYKIVVEGKRLGVTMGVLRVIPAVSLQQANFRQQLVGGVSDI